MSNIEGMYSINFIKRWSDTRRKRLRCASDSLLRHSSFVIRYSTVRCFIKTIDTVSLIIKKPCHFGVVSYKIQPGSRLPLWAV